MKTAITFLSLLIAVFCNAQSGHITGQVVDRDHIGIEFSNVMLFSAIDSSLIKGNVSREKGQYDFFDIPYGNYYIEISSIGYETFSSSIIEIKDKNHDIGVMTLSTSEVAIDEVLVTAQKPFLELKGESIVVNVASSPTSGGKTALELLEQSPGVSVDRNSNNISLRGKAGVQVMIDGKRSFMSREDLNRYLQNLAAEAIESIEIMSNPSAKYDAEGNAGIINIKLKKNENFGTNGSISGGFGYGKTPKYNGGINLNSRNKYTNVYGSYRFNHWENENGNDITRSIPNEGGFSLIDQYNDRQNISNSNRLKTGLDYYLSEKTTIGILYQKNFGKWENNGAGKSTLTGINTEGWDELRVKTMRDGDWDENTYNINLAHNFSKSGHSINFDADLSQFEGGNIQDNYNSFFDTEGSPTLPENNVRNDVHSDIDILAFKVDYSNPLTEKVNLEAGTKFSSVESQNILDYYQGNNEVWTFSQDQSDNFKYTEDIYAVYASLSFPIANFQIKAGLRLENTVSNGNSLALGQEVDRDTLNFFPTLSVSRQINDNHSLSFSYSKRIDRPNYQDLNPFVFYLDQYTFGKGNPFLSPQYTNSYGLNWGFFKKYFLTLNYSQTNAVLTDVILQDEENLTTFQTKQNLDTYRNFSATLTVPVSITDWWRLRSNLNLFYQHTESPFEEGGNVNNENWAANFYVNNSISLPKSWNAELSAWYNTKTYAEIFQISSQYAINFGLSKPLFEGKGRLSVNVNDIFQTSFPEITIKQGDVDAIVKPYWESRRFNVSLSYNFGNQKVKSRQRKTATEDEKSRINSQG